MDNAITGRGQEYGERRRWKAREGAEQKIRN
jgi:hypothetical protein